MCMRGNFIYYVFQRRLLPINLPIVVVVLLNTCMYLVFSHSFILKNKKSDINLKFDYLPTFCGQCLHIGRPYKLKKKAAIALQCNSNVKPIAASLFIHLVVLFEEINHLKNKKGEK